MRKEKKYTIIYLSVCIIFLIVSITVSILKNTNTNTKLAKKEEIKLVQSEENLDETINSNEITEVSNFEEEKEIVSEEFENNEESEVVEVKEEAIEKEKLEEKDEKEEQSYFKIVNTTSTNKTKTEKTSNTSKTERKEKTEREKATEALKEVLTDKKWLKENVMMDTSCFDTKLEYEQTLTFMLLKGGKDVIVQAMSEDDLSTQIFLVSYDNGGITVTPFSEFPSHCSHVNFSVDANNFIVEYTYVHMGNFETIIFEIGKEEFKKVKEIISYPDMNDISNSEFIYEIDGQNVTEFEYNTALKNEYNFNYIETELNDTNVNKYVK